jgi:NAD(P)-dependent dehydrogenase (short-subunit alcohol dehydrogenase family)
VELGLAGKNAIVTGGAKGIGSGISEVLAEEGANLVIDYRSDPEYCERFSKDLAEKYSVNTIAVQADVSIEEEVNKLYDIAFNTFGTIDILVNNAGGGHPGSHKPFQDLEIEDFRRVQDNNLNSAFMMSRIFVRHCLEKRKGGHIVNVLSKSAITTNSFNNTSYISAKGGLLTMTRGLAHEVARYGIFVNGIVPGYVENSKGSHKIGSERGDRVIQYIPTKRFGTPREMGNVVAFLCSEKSSQMIGAIVDCSGGTML